MSNRKLDPCSQLYVVRDHTAELTKIGISRDSVRRAKMLAKEHKGRTELIAAYEVGESARLLEAAVKKRLWKWRARTHEWFAVDPNTMLTVIRAESATKLVRLKIRRRVIHEPRPGNYHWFKNRLGPPDLSYLD